MTRDASLLECLLGMAMVAAYALALLALWLVWPA